MATKDPRPKPELTHGYSPRTEKGYKPASAKITAPKSSPKPPPGNGAGSQKKSE